MSQPFLIGICLHDLPIMWLAVTDKWSMTCQHCLLTTSGAETEDECTDDWIELTEEEDDERDGRGTPSTAEAGT